MEQNEKWLNWAVELQSLAQAGLFYTKDPFDKERYARIREITAEMLSAKTGVSVEKVKDIFCTDTGYQTPKLDTRSAIFNDRGQILLVQENDGRWSLPGGWVDVNVSVTENAAGERRQGSAGGGGTASQSRPGDRHTGSGEAQQADLRLQGVQDFSPLHGAVRCLSGKYRDRGQRLL